MHELVQAAGFVLVVVLLLKIVGWKHAFTSAGCTDFWTSFNKNNACIAQLVEQCVANAQVAGSSPVARTTYNV